MRKKKIAHYLHHACGNSRCAGILSITGTVAHAAGLVDSMMVSDANAYSKYPLENYQLDFYVDLLIGCLGTG